VQRTPGIAAWNGPYLKGGNVPNDPWNHPYVYRSPGERSPYEIVSYGARWSGGRRRRRRRYLNREPGQRKE